MDEPSWKKIKLSLERPYKDDNGEYIPTLLDITPEGEHIYEPRVDWTAQLGEKFGKIFLERGPDFFEHTTQDVVDVGRPSEIDGDAGLEDSLAERTAEALDDTGQKSMTPEQLLKMRMEIIPRLHIAMGEMSHARDLLSLLLSASLPAGPPPVASLPSGSLSSTTVSKLPPIPSLQAFDAQLVTGGKDDALRKASNVLKVAAEGMERGTTRSEKYWSDALKIRKGNWGLIPAPLPFGSATGKGADRTSKDFLVSYGLEESSSQLLRRAVGQMANHTSESKDGPSVIFPQRQTTRLRVSLKKCDERGTESSTYYNTIIPENGTSLDDAIRGAQREVVEQEIFAELIKEAGNLPTAAARVSERLIAIEAAQGVELQFELVDNELLGVSSPEASISGGGAVCDLIYSALHILLLRAHAHTKTYRLGSAGVVKAAVPPRPLFSPLILHPIIDLMQYQVFCDRIKHELSRMAQALSRVAISATLRFHPIGESGEQVVKSLVDDVKGKAGGEAVLRIDDRQSIRFTFLSPSALTAHLPQATIAVASIPQLCQLLIDEVERGLLGRICEIGTEACEIFNGIWFVDEMMCRSVGRWEGCVLNFRVVCAEDCAIDAIAKRLDRDGGESASMVINYSARTDKALGLFAWVKYIIEETLAR